MNKSNCVIPYEITFYIPGDNYDFGDKVLEDGSIPATFVGSKDSSTKKANAKLSLVNNNWGALNKDGVVKEVTVLNTGFTISLSPNNIKIRYYYNNEVSFLVTSDSLIEALGETPEENSIGKPDSPTLPLFGSENVQISNEEEKIIE